MLGLFNILTQTTYSYQNTSNPEDLTGFWIFMAVYSVCFGIFYLVMYLITSISMYKVGKKLNDTSSWWAFVPVLSSLLIHKLGDIPMWYILLGLIPVVNLVYIYFYIKAWLNILKKLNKPDWHILLVLFVTLIYLPYLGFSKE